MNSIKQIVSYFFIFTLFIGCKEKPAAIIPVTPPPPVVVKPPLSSAFISKVLAKGEVQFTNTSISAETYEWDFGDGSEKSTELSPKHVYKYNGVYKAVLKATDKKTTLTADENISVNTTIDKFVEVPLGQDASLANKFKYIIVQESTGIKAINLEGETVWSFNDGINVISLDQPVIYENLMYVNISDAKYKLSEKVCAVDINTGKLIKTYPFYDVNEFAIAEGLLVATTATGIEAVDIKTGKMVWKIDENHIGLSYINATINEGIFYTIKLQKNYSFLAYELKTGKLLWENSLNGSDMNFIKEPIIQKNRIFFNTVEYLVAFDNKTGKELWKLPRSAKSNLVALTARNDTLYWNPNLKELSAINATNGQVLWNLKTSFGVGAPYLIGNTIYDQPNVGLVR